MLEVRNLTKCYSRIPAVRELSFVVKPYEILGCLGPNGSGKTTIVNMLTGLLEPTDGEIFFEGRNIRGDIIAYKHRLGYVPEVPHLYPYLTGREYLQLVGQLRSLPKSLMTRKIDGFIELLGLGSDGHVPISSYSKGMKQKILISAALLHNPDVLIFDEPLSGLDVTSALVFRNLVRSLAAEGKIILYSSHVLEVVEKLCSHVIILRQGRAVANDSVDHLRHLMKLPNLGDIFAELVLKEDTDQIAKDIVGVMRLEA